MKTKQFIVVNLRFEGFHFWLEAPEEVDFLRHRHRHMFWIRCVAEVSHADRQIELILFKREIVDYLIRTYGKKDNEQQSTCWLEFGSMSCEMIAQDLCEAFNLTKCEVSEDGENGGLVVKVIEEVKTLL